MSNIVNSLKMYGLSETEAEIYLSLLRHGPQTTVQLSRHTKISRQKIYRNIEILQEKGFVKELVKGYGARYAAESYEKLEFILKRKKHDYEDLESAAPALFSQLSALQAGLSNESEILHYRGIEGLKQVTYNTLKAKDTFRSYEIDLLHSVVDQRFAEEMRLEYSKMPIQFHQLTNKTIIEAFTNVTKHIEQWEVRHIPESEFEIKFEIQIYNDVYCMYEYTEGDIFIVEIHNSKLAQMQKQIYDFIWRNANPMRLVDIYGGSTL